MNIEIYDQTESRAYSPEGASCPYCSSGAAFLTFQRLNQTGTAYRMSTATVGRAAQVNNQKILKGKTL